MKLNPKDFWGIRSPVYSKKYIDFLKGFTFDYRNLEETDKTISGYWVTSGGDRYHFVIFKKYNLFVCERDRRLYYHVIRDYEEITDENDDWSTFWKPLLVPVKFPQGIELSQLSEETKKNLLARIRFEVDI